MSPERFKTRREKEKAKRPLILAGASEKEARGALRQQAEAPLLEQQRVEAEEARIETAKRTAEPVLEEAGAFEEVTPKEVSLQPRRAPGEGIPVIGRTVAVEFSILDNAVSRGWIPGFLVPGGKGTIKGAKAGVPTVEEEFPLPMTPETVREAALREIRAVAFRKGITKSESFGAMVEAIPGVGGLIGKYVGGLVEAPYSNAQRVLKQINTIKEDASTGQEKVRNGLETPEFGLSEAERMEAQIAKLEGRLKLLINSSAVLRAGADEVNNIQEQILAAKKKVSRYRTASSFGLTAQLTGTGRPIPTDEQIYYELRDLKGGG